VKPRRRWLLIALAAIGTGIAAWSAPEDPAPQGDAATPSAQSAPPAPLLELPVRQRLRPLRSPLFAPPAPPKPPAPQPVQAEPPRPPPNPYRYVGSLEVGGQRRVLLATVDDKIVEATEGVRLEQGWRVQAVTPQAVTLVYEPLNEPVSVALVFPELPPRAPQPQAATGQTAPPPAPGVPQPAQLVPQPVPQAVPGKPVH
jgi:hypothetical protein